MKRQSLKVFGEVLFILALTFLFVVNGFLLPLKSTIVKGNNINDIMINSGAYVYFREIWVDYFMYTDNVQSSGVDADAIGNLLDDELLEIMGKELIESLTDGKDIDLSAAADILSDKVEKGLRDTIDKAFEEIQANEITVVSAEVIKDNDAVKKFQDEFGRDISGLITEAIMEQYGQESIDLSQVDINEAKNKVNSYLEEYIYPEISKYFEQMIEEISSEINMEKQESIYGIDVKEFFKIADEITRFSTILLYIILALIAGLVLIELLIYKTCIYRAFRNIYISLILPSFITTLAGGTVIAGIPMIVKETALNQVDEMLLETPMEIAIKAYSRFANATIITGIAYIVLFVVLIILASRFKAIQSRTVDDPNNI